MIVRHHRGLDFAGERYPLRRLSHRNQAPPLASRGNLDAIGDKRKHRPSAMEQHSRNNNNKATWDRTNGGTFPKVGKGGQRRRVDRELAVRARARQTLKYR
jgi:hypothetical protein